MLVTLPSSVPSLYLAFSLFSPLPRLTSPALSLGLLSAASCGSEEMMASKKALHSLWKLQDPISAEISFLAFSRFHLPIPPYKALQHTHNREILGCGIFPRASFSSFESLSTCYGLDRPCVALHGARPSS